MNELRKFVSPEFVFGDNARLLLGQYIEHFGIDKVLLVTDENIQTMPWYQDIISNLNDHGISFVTYNKVAVNPRDYDVRNGTQVYLDNTCDMIVAVGGGSVMDCAKGIGVLVSNPGDIIEYEGVDQIYFPIPPLICVPTTSGSSADVSQFAIITNTNEKYKMALASKILVPDLSLIDPIVTLTCDFDVTIDTGIDALVHATEAYVSNASSFVTNTHALSAVEKILKYLPALSRDLNSLNLRRKIMEACLSAGLAFSNASLGLTHAMAHAIGGRMDLVHGELNAMLLEHVIAFNYDHASIKYNRIHKILNEIYGEYPTLEEGIHAFINDIRPNKFVDASPIEDIRELSEYVLKDPCIVTNPKEASLEDVVMIYEKIFK
jgi:alcohol dehydrogenase class IV